jgi:hypothetical protein
MQGEEREILKDLSAAVVLVPASSLLWQGGVQAAQQPSSVDPSKVDLVAKIVNRAIADPEFRKVVKARPVETLADMGLTPPSDIAKTITALQYDAEQLVRCILGEVSPLKSIVMQSATIFTIPILPVVLTLPDTTAFDPWVAC